MSKKGITTNLLAPAPAKTVQFVGNYPSRVFKIIQGLMKDAFGMDSGSMWEDKIQWDTSSNIITFYGMWRGKIGLDARSKIWIEVEATGTQSKENNEGEVSIKIKGKLQTEFKYPTLLHMGIYKLYNTIFYKKQREQYMIEANRKIDDFENMIRSQFDMMRRSE